jgi:hypothetical protein
MRTLPAIQSRIRHLGQELRHGHGYRHGHGHSHGHGLSPSPRSGARHLEGARHRVRSVARPMGAEPATGCAQKRVPFLRRRVAL